MDISSFLEKLIVIVSVLGSLGTAIGTFMATRNQTKESDASTDKTRTFIPIDAAERISSISLNLIQNVQTQLADCVQKRDELGKELNDSIEQANSAKVRLRKLVSKLRDIRERHDKLYHELQSTCPGYEVLNGMIDTIITEIETELEDID